MTENTQTEHPMTCAFRLYSALLPEVAALGGNDDNIKDAIEDCELLHDLALLIQHEASLTHKVAIRSRDLELTFAGDKIIALKSVGFNLELGDVVVANGRIGVMDGTVGYVIKFSMPGQGGRTSDIIDVFFKGTSGIMQMKLKDLRPFGRES
ncbi:MAG: hypothetical protein Q7S57_06360 [bacterium]|nr:hypothetical protein [bacterium]